MKLFNQFVLVFFASTFCLTTHAQTLSTNDCVQSVSDALKLVELQQLTKTEVICLSSKGSTEMYVYWSCDKESSITQDYYLQAAVGDGKFCRVNYRSGKGNCSSLTGSFEQQLKGKEVSAKRRELADFCNNVPPPQ